MRSHSGKDLAREISRLRAQLEALSDRSEEITEDTLRPARELIAKYADTAKSVARDAVKLRDKASDTLVEHTEARPLSTLAALVAIGFLAGWAFRRFDRKRLGSD
jgi:ElaB/YqjD/DUF883 family membrane-anchored ribosome-binding protein